MLRHCRLLPKSVGSRRFAAAALLLGAIGAISSAAAQTTKRAPAFRGSDLVAAPTTAWPTNGGDWYNQRYSPLGEINRDNVAKLKGVWRTHLKGSGLGAQYSGEAQPIVYDGVIYIVTGADDVFAIDVDSSEILWEYRANLDPANNNVCCGWTSRGIGLGDGKVFVGQLDGKLVALDQRTGKVAWSTQAERWQEGFTITSAPLYYDGLVITGFAGGEKGIRGRVKAFGAKDGKLAWTFYTIPGPGEPGHETWPQTNELWQDGGVPVWNTPAVDPKLGLIFFATGNPGPDYNGGVRKGDNLFSSSIVALDVKTGKYRWHFQQVHHDIWDFDGASPVTLFDLEIDGVMRKGIAEASKTGWVYILDRETGKPLVGIDEKPVPQEPRQATAATQPFPRGDAFVPQSIPIPPEGAGPLVNGGKIFTPFWLTPVLAKPGPPGGANWMPSSYDPQAGHLFVCAGDRIWAFIAKEIDEERPPPGEYIGGGIGGRFNMPALGTFSALDMRTNKLVWQQHLPEPCYSGSLATAGGLVFVGRNDGRLTALNSSTGIKVWEFQTGAGMNSPASSFEHNGHQYVVAYAGGNLFGGSARGDSVWLFSLDGKLDPVPPAGALMTFAPGTGGAPNVDAGKVVYDTACTFCHGEAAEGGHGGGPTLQAIKNAAIVMQKVSEGGKDMPALGAVLTSEQIRDVAGYVTQRLAK